MKARRKKTRWLLVALLFGFLAATGLGLVHRDDGGADTARNALAPPNQPLSPPRQAPLLARIVATRIERAPARPLGERAPSAALSQSSPAPAPGRSVPPHVGSSPPLLPGGPHSDPAPERIAVPGGSAGQLAYNSYVPLDCELPAGCGASPGAGVATDSNPNPSNTQPHSPIRAADPPGGSSPGGSGSPRGPGAPAGSSGPDPLVASAPELDPATLAGALTLLIGTLALVRSRRLRRSR